MPDRRPSGVNDGVWLRAGLAAFVAVNLLLIVINGVSSGGDTGLYVDGARAMLQGHPLIDRQPSYTGYIAIVALSLAAGAGLAGVIAIQLLAATAAAYAVWRVAGALGGSFAAAIAVWLFALDVDTNRWHRFVLSDSLFLSVATITVWLVYRVSAGGSLGARMVASVMLLITALIRPEGWFLIPLALAFWVWRMVAPVRVRAAGVAGVIALCVVMAVLVVPRLGGNLKAVGPADMLRAGQTIWDFNGWRVPMPADPVFEDGNRTSGDAVVYAFRHPISTVALMLARLGVHFAHVRPYFSPAHNAAIVVWLVPVYALAAWALWKTRSRALTVWLAAAAGSQLFVVALTHADWDGRYLSHMMPLIYPLTAYAVAAAAGRLPLREEAGA
jgi:hypothetical protein